MARWSYSRGWETRKGKKRRVRSGKKRVSKLLGKKMGYKQRWW